MTEDWVTTIIVAVVMVVGLIGTLFPVLPGILMMWAIALAYGFSTEFGNIGVITMVLLTILTIVSLAAGYFLPKQAAADSGASRRSQVFGMLGGIIGFFVIPVVGVIVGALIGVLLGEFGEKGSFDVAWTSTMATAKGFGLSALVQFGIGFVMLLMWSVWAATVVL